MANATSYRQFRLTVEQKAENVRIDTERRNAESLQAESVRLLDQRHRYATRFAATVADSVVANASTSNNVLIVQPEFDPIIPSARTARASREVQSDAQQREAARARASKRREHKLDNPVNIAEAIRIGAPTCEVNAHLNYVNATGIDVWNGDPEHVIDVIPDFTKPDIEDQWNQARQLEDAMVAEIFDASVCACCGHQCPHSDMHIGLTDTTDPNILEILISCET